MGRTRPAVWDLTTSSYVGVNKLTGKAHHPPACHLALLLATLLVLAVMTGIIFGVAGMSVSVVAFVFAFRVSVNWRGHNRVTSAG